MNNSCQQNKKNLIQRKCSRGFTLLEVMIALVMVSIVLPALLMSMGTILDSLGHMENKTHAYWLAENKVQTILLEKKLGNKLPSGTKTEEEKYIEREWEIETQAQEIDYAQFDAKIVRFDVRVKLAGDDDNGWLATLTGFIDAAPEQPFSGTQKAATPTSGSPNSQGNNSSQNNNSQNSNGNNSSGSSSNNSGQNTSRGGG